MKPTLSEKERTALQFLGKKQPDQVDPFDTHIRNEIGRLSMAIDKGSARLAELKTDTVETEQDLVRDVGAFQATARTYLAYIESSMIRPVSSPTDPPIPESPQEAAEESTPESGTPTPPEPETASDDPEQGQDEAKEPESENVISIDPEKS